MHNVKYSARRVFPAAAIWAGVLIAAMSPATALAQFPCDAITEVSQLENTDPVNGIGMGYALDADGVFMVAGVPNASVAGVQRGAAYVYERVAGTWVARQTLSASDGAAGDSFGYSVAMDGDTIVVGSPENDAGFTNNGAVYVFVRSGTSWQEQAKLAVTNVFVGFGGSVDVSGDRLIAGAPAYQNAVGRAYIYQRTGTVWSLESTVNSLAPVSLGHFGAEVAIDGSTAAVVQSSTIDGALGQYPRIDVFTRSGSTWSHQDRVTYVGTVVAFFDFGESIALQGDRLIVGAPRRTPGAVNQSGAAYVFTRSAGEWSQFQLLVPVVMTTQGEFGSDVDIAADGTIVVGYPGRFVGAPTFEDEPAVVTFRLAGGFWAQQHVIVAPDSPPSSTLGKSVAIVADGAGHAVLATDPSLAVGSDVGAGTIHAAEITTSMWTYEEALTEPFRLGEGLGAAVDVEADYAVVGAPGEDSAQGIDAGAAYVYKRIAGVWTRMQRIAGGDLASYDYFGRAVSISGSTIVVAAARHNGVGGSNSGAVYVFTRSGEAWSQEAKIQASDAASADLFGTSLFITGNRLIVGAPGDDLAGGTNQGSAYVFLRSAGVWTQESKLVALDRATGDEFGISVVITTIGFPTPSVVALVGAYGDDHAGGTNAGSVYVFKRTPMVDFAVWDQTARFSSPSVDTDDNFGYSIAAEGTLVVVGSPFGDGPEAGPNGGSAFLFVSGNSSGTVWSQVTEFPLPFGNPYGWQGASVAISGGYIAVGRPEHWEPQIASWPGSVYVYKQVGSDWLFRTYSSAESQWMGRIGESVALSGTTLFAGAPLRDSDMGADSGGAFVFEIDPSDFDPISISTQPEDQQVCPGGTVSFSIATSDDEAAILYWVPESPPGSNQFSSSWDVPESEYELIGSIDGPVLTVRNVSPTAPPRKFKCLVYGCVDMTESVPALLSVRATDFDCSGASGVPDIFSFLSRWFASDPLADFDDNNIIAVPDIFAFLSAWFAG